MDFYMAYYKRQCFKKEINDWRDTAYVNQQILVIANSIEEATSKINELIKHVEHGNYRAVQNSKVIKCEGLDLRQGSEGSFYVLPIVYFLDSKTWEE